MSKRINVTLAYAIILLMSIFLAGCGLFGTKDKENIDPPNNEVTHFNEGEDVEASPDAEMAGEESDDTVMRDIYLIDKNGLVVAQSLPLPKTESVARQALEYLVSDGPVTSVLPNGFRTVLPAGTEVEVHIDNGMAYVDFSEEFTGYNASDEKKILQSITWTLTQFDSINAVELRVNGYPLTEMPVDGTPISPDGLTRADGINTEFNSDVADITNTRPVTVYYLTQGTDDFYYVPVTRRVTNTEKDNIVAVIKELSEGSIMQTALISALNDGVALMEEPKIEEGNVTLNFNEAILGNSENKVISNEALQSLVLSLTEQSDIDSVSIMVNGSPEIVNEEGDVLTAPVTRPEKVNSGSF